MCRDKVSEMTQHFDFRVHMRRKPSKRRPGNVSPWRPRVRGTFDLSFREIMIGATGMASVAAAVLLLPTTAGGQSKTQIAMLTPGAAPSQMAARTFSRCHTGGGVNCVVDGDTFWMNGEKIRIADIDTPETHPSRCAEEARLGNAATDRLQSLLNQGGFDLKAINRDTDRYGRKLRIVERNGASIGGVLVIEGLARPYRGGYREGWCA